MKIKKIFTSALSLCGESNTAPYLADFAVDWANTLLAELYETEQSIRAANGEQLLSTVPVLITAEDEAPYDDTLVRGAFVLGFAALICDLCDDRELAATFRARAANAAQNAAKAHEHQVCDIYGTEVST